MEGADNSYVAAILQAVREAYPNEACGLLVGRAGLIHEAIPVTNIARDPRRAYAIAPEDLLAVHRSASRRDEAIVGVFHSHPDGPPELSAHDRAQAQIGWTYVVVATNGSEPSGLTITTL
jgi:proteasome lid subunit RPN8/RPN11